MCGYDVILVPSLSVKRRRGEKPAAAKRMEPYYETAARLALVWTQLVLLACGQSYCPDLCYCYQNLDPDSYTYTVDCSYKERTSIPRFIPASTTHLLAQFYLRMTTVRMRTFLSPSLSPEQGPKQ